MGIEDAITFEQRLARRLRYEEAVSACSRVLLGGAPHAIDRVLEHLLAASEVSRVYIFENFDDPGEGLCMKQTHEACAPGTEPQIGNPILQRVPYLKGFQRWKRALEQGEHIVGSVSEFPESERAILESQDILSMLVLPIRTAERWFGFVGFDDTQYDRSWTEEDVRLLRTAAEIIGFHLSQEQYRRILKQNAEELQSALGMRDRLFAILSHDLRNPLASLKHGLQLMTEHNEHLAEDERRRVARDLSRQVDTTLELLDNLLQWSRHQQGGSEPDRKPIDLAPLVRAAVELYGAAADQKSICVTIDVPPNLRPIGDRQMVQLVLRNLIGNAIKFTLPEGSIQVVARSRGSMVRVEVRDDGVGMDAESADRIFGRGRVVSTVGTARETGSGVGLLLCRDFVHALGGDIEAASEPGVGSTFAFTLPTATTGGESTPR